MGGFTSETNRKIIPFQKRRLSPNLLHGVNLHPILRLPDISLQGVSAARASFRHFIRKTIRTYRGPKAHPKFRNTKRTPRLHEFFRKVRANFCLLHCVASQEHNENCSQTLVQMNFFILGGFFRVDFPPLNLVDLRTQAQNVVLPGLAESHGGFFFQCSGPKL